MDDSGEIFVNGECQTDQAIIAQVISPMHEPCSNIRARLKPPAIPLRMASEFKALGVVKKIGLSTKAEVNKISYIGPEKTICLLIS